jgi:hypothetical protein
MRHRKGKKRVFSGVQPSGRLHIGNYLGALSLWVELQDLHEKICCVVDLHALTIPESISPAGLHAKSREVAALYLACGIDPMKNAVFIQSHIHEHTELAWVLNCVTPVGWLERMTQFKTKAKQSKSVSTGLFDYPVLQAADVLLYKTDLVPVGEDQRQHIEGLERRCQEDLSLARLPWANTTMAAAPSGASKFPPRFPLLLAYHIRALKDAVTAHARLLRPFARTLVCCPARCKLGHPPGLRVPPPALTPLAKPPAPAGCAMYGPAGRGPPHP